MIGIVWTLVSGKVIAAFRWATQSAAHIFAVGMVFALAWGAIERHGKHKAQRVLASTIVAWKAAEREATAAQQALNAAFSERSSTLAKESSHEHEKALSGARSAVAAYARLHPAPRCASSETKPAAVSDSPGLDAGPGDAPAMASITVADLDTLAAGTVRAESCRAWGAAMIDAGLAEAGD